MAICAAGQIGDDLARTRILIGRRLRTTNKNQPSALRIAGTGRLERTSDQKRIDRRVSVITFGGAASKVAPMRLLHRFSLPAAVNEWQRQPMLAALQGDTEYHRLVRGVPVR